MSGPVISTRNFSCLSALARVYAFVKKKGVELVRKEGWVFCWAGGRLCKGLMELPLALGPSWWHLTHLRP